MISTFEALLVVVIALLPGATYTWAFALQAGHRGANFSDRVWRFAGTSAVFVSLVLPLLYLAYRQLVVTDRLVQGSPIPWWIWTLPPAYVLLPWLIGGLTGTAVRRRRKWVRFLTGVEDNDVGVALRSYLSAYPESQGLYLSDTAAVDGDGAVTVDVTGRPMSTGLGVLVRWDEVAYAYFGEG